MAKRQLPGAGFWAFWVLGKDLWKDENDINWRLASALLGGFVKSRTTSLPGVPSLGDVYIVPSADLNGNDIAVWDGEAGAEVWNYFTPRKGWNFFVEDEAINVQWLGAIWDQFAAAGGGVGGGGGGPSGPLLHVRDEKVNGTAGGGSAVGTQARSLGTVVTNEIAGASLAINQITLPAGTYFVMARAPSLQPLSHKIILRNVTDGSDQIIGGSAYSSSSDTVVTRAHLAGQFSISATKVLELEHYIENAKAVDGLGVPSSEGAVEVYSEVLIWQIPETGVFHCRHEEASGVAGGASAAATWNLRALNSVLTNEITGASLLSNQITLPAGKYRVSASAPAYVSAAHKLRLRNVTDVSDTAIGSSEFTHDAAFVQTRSHLLGQFTIGATKTFELQHYTTQAKTINGLGNAISASVVEVYAEVFIERLG